MINQSLLVIDGLSIHLCSKEQGNHLHFVYGNLPSVPIWDISTAVSFCDFLIDSGVITVFSKNDALTLLRERLEASSDVVIPEVLREAPDEGEILEMWMTFYQSGHGLPLFKWKGGSELVYLDCDFIGRASGGLTQDFLQERFPLNTQGRRFCPK